MGTVSLVLVSHSRQLAEGVRELAAQMTQGKVKIAVSGGTADGRLGTDATAILAAIEEVRGPEGVLILVDLGSAVLSTQMAIEQLPDGKGRVILIGFHPQHRAQPHATFKLLWNALALPGLTEEELR